MKTIEKHYSDDGFECIPKLKAGDLIEFDFFGRMIRGRIEIVGVYGYWVSHGIGHGSARCPFGKETKLDDET